MLVYKDAQSWYKQNKSYLKLENSTLSPEGCKVRHCSLSLCWDHLNSAGDTARMGAGLWIKSTGNLETLLSTEYSSSIATSPGKKWGDWMVEREGMKGTGVASPVGARWSAVGWGVVNSDWRIDPGSHRKVRGGDHGFDGETWLGWMELVKEDLLNAEAGGLEGERKMVEYFMTAD